MGAEVPVWVGGLQKWVTGLTKKTTCEDIVRVLLRSEGRPLAVEERDWRNYVIVERWRRVERPLDATTKIAKVWRAWGEEQGNVRLTLKRMPPPPTSGGATDREQGKSTSSNSSKKRSNPKLWRQQQAVRTSTLHPRKLQQQQQQQQAMLQGGHRHSDMDGRITDTMERLMKVIIAQGETIQAQLRRLQEKDEQIDHFEHQTHATRVEEMGENYLVDSYLGSDGQPLREGGPVLAPSTSRWDGDEPDDVTEPNSLRDVKRCVRHYERFLSLCERLEREEEAVLWLSSQLSQRQKQQLQEMGEGDSGATSELLVELEAMQGRVERLSVINVANDADIGEHEAAIQQLDCLLDDKRCYVGLLERDLMVAERETETLQRLEYDCAPSTGVVVLDEAAGETSVMDTVVSSAQSPVGGVRIRDKDHGGDTDSNSDTGLSSLHSSSDDGAYGLDTLV